VAQTINLNQTIRDYSKRLRAFIGQRVASDEDAEDILQDVFYQLVEAERLTKPIEELTAWLYSVTRNRITDWYRKKRPERLPEQYDETEILSEMESIEDFFYNEELAFDLAELSDEMWVRLQSALARCAFQRNIETNRRSGQHAYFAKALRGATLAKAAANYI